MANSFKERFIEICEKARLVGANTVFVKNDKVLERHHFGYQDLENKVPTSDKTIYRIASISKTVGSIALMQQYELGKFDLDCDISDILGFTIRNPKYPDDVITPRMILTQTSSIVDGYDDENPKYNDIVKGYNGVNGSNLKVSLKELLTDTSSIYYTDKTFSDYRPGERFIYSNFGCGIMACMVEMLSGELFTEYMINHIFKPLNIDASFVAKDIERKENIASVYLPSNDGYVICRSGESFVTSSYKKWPLGDNYRGPAGGLFIDMDDLSKIMRMFLRYGEVDGVRLLKKETIDLMYQMHWFGNGENDGYHAKGLQMKVMDTFQDRGIVFRGHTGGAYGVRSYMFFNQKYDLGAIFITNGGYYKTDEEHAILDVFYNTLDEYIKLYFDGPSASCFEIEIGSSIAKVDNRVIKLFQEVYEYNGEVYLPIINFCDGIGIVGLRNEDTDTIKLKFNGKEVVYNNPTKFDDVAVLPVYDTCNKLGIKVERNNNKLAIKY